MTMLTSVAGAVEALSTSRICRIWSAEGEDEDTRSSAWLMRSPPYEMASSISGKDTAGSVTPNLYCPSASTPLMACTTGPARHVPVTRTLSAALGSSVGLAIWMYMVKSLMTVGVTPGNTYSRPVTTMRTSLTASRSPSTCDTFTKMSGVDIRLGGSRRARRAKGWKKVCACTKKGTLEGTMTVNWLAAPSLPSEA